MTTTRRELLAAGATGAVGLTVLGRFLRPAGAAPEKEITVWPALVVLFLRGGQDALNTLVPHGDARYYEMRPNIAVPPPDKNNGCLALDDTFGLNPGLTGFKKLWEAGLLAPIVNTGLGHPSRSHFACQDYMEYGALADATVRSGWLNRFLHATRQQRGDQTLRGLALQGRLPRSLRGPESVLAAAPEEFRLGPRGEAAEDPLALFDDLYPSGGAPSPMGERGADPAGERAGPSESVDLRQVGRETIESMERLRDILAQPAAVETVRYPSSLGRLGQQLMMAGRLLKSGQGVEVIGLDWNGWDHHIREGGAGEQDLIRRMNQTLGDAFALFYEDISFMKSKVTTIIMTEFGRTNAENGNLGTDHGHGGNMYLIGGNVRGGRIFGDWTGLAPGKSYQNRDLLVTTDWRAVLHEVLVDFMHLSPSVNLFSGFEPPPNKLGLFQTG